MPSQEENKLIKRTKIIEAAYDLFSKNGINMTPIDDVVKKAGVAKGTFYLYFHDKYALTDQIVLHESTIIVKRVLEEVTSSDGWDELEPVDQIVKYVDRIIDNMIDNREVLVLIQSKLSGFFQLIISDNSPEIKQNIMKIIDMFVNMGYSQESAKKYLYIISNMIVTVCCEAILDASPFTIEEIRPEIHTMLKNLLNNSNR